MTATEEPHGRLDTGYPYTLRPELHKALMARGIDYWVAQGITFWNRDDGCECLAYGYKVDRVPKLVIKVVGFTDPAQAVEATMGRGECHMETAEGCQNWNSCSVCHADYYTDQKINYCPNCGRRVV